MPTSDDFIEFPVFGDNSDKEKPDDPKYAAGFLPGDVLPAEWLNWFLNTISQGYNELVDNAVEFSPDSINTITNKNIAYDDNSMPGVQPTLTAGTGIDITGTTISASENIVTGVEIKTSNTFNGKPVYLKCLEWTGSQTVTTNYDIGINVSDVAEVVKEDRIFWRGTQSFWTSSGVYLPGSDYVEIQGILNNGSLRHTLNIHVSSSLPLNKIRLFIYYTKTTD